MNVRRKNANSGFTLVELLVALTILSLVIGLTFGSLRFGARVADSVDRQVARSQSIHLVQRMLRRQLQQAVPVIRTDGQAPARLDFAARSDRFEFVAPMTAGTGNSGLYRISIEISDDVMGDVAGKKLLFRFRLLTADDDARFPGYDVRESVILDGFADAEFAYFDDSGRGSRDWQHEWKDERRFPALVRLRIDYAESDDASWPDLVVALRATSLSIGAES